MEQQTSGISQLDGKKVQPLVSTKWKLIIMTFLRRTLTCAGRFVKSPKLRFFKVSYGSDLCSYLATKLDDFELKHSFIMKDDAFFYQFFTNFTNVM